MKASVIFSTYNSEEWLEKVIWDLAYKLPKISKLLLLMMALEKPQKLD